MDEDEQEKVYGLATPLAKQDPSDELTLPDLNIESEETNELVEKFKDAEAKKKLFVNCWFWLNRETPKEVLALIIRCSSKFHILSHFFVFLKVEIVYSLKI